MIRLVPVISINREPIDTLSIHGIVSDLRCSRLSGRSRVDEALGIFARASSSLIGSI